MEISLLHTGTIRRILHLLIFYLVHTNQHWTNMVKENMQLRSTARNTSTQKKQQMERPGHHSPHKEKIEILVTIITSESRKKGNIQKYYHCKDKPLSTCRDSSAQRPVLSFPVPWKQGSLSIQTVYPALLDGGSPDDVRDMTAICTTPELREGHKGTKNWASWYCAMIL